VLALLTKAFERLSEGPTRTRAVHLGFT